MHFWSFDITIHEIYKIDHISAIFKDKDFWFRPKNSLILFAEHFTMFGGHQVHFWSHDSASTFLKEKCQYL